VIPSLAMPSSIVTFLAQQPEAELREMQSKLEAERARVEVELEQVAEALSRQSRRTGGRAPQRGGRTPARSGATQKRILAAVGRASHPVSPAQVIAEMEREGVTPSRGSIHNTIGRLYRNGQLVKVADGLYQLASRNGADSVERAGPHKNETSDPLFTGSGAQEAS